jgi:hypothetical protein
MAGEAGAAHDHEGTLRRLYGVLPMLEKLGQHPDLIEQLIEAADTIRGGRERQRELSDRVAAIEHQPANGPTEERMAAVEASVAEFADKADWLKTHEERIRKLEDATGAADPGDRPPLHERITHIERHLEDAAHFSGGGNTGFVPQAAGGSTEADAGRTEQQPPSGGTGGTEGG